jgi:hypothetical protein
MWPYTGKNQRATDPVSQLSRGTTMSRLVNVMQDRLRAVMKLKKASDL